MTTFGMDAGCYVYKPDVAQIRAKQGDDDETDNAFPKKRLDAFHRVWTPVEDALQKVLSSADSGAVARICDYLATIDLENQDRLPTGLITTTTAGSLFTKVKEQAQKDILFISVPASQCTNLKSALKCIASSVFVKSETRLLNYDLDALKLFMDAEHFEKVVLYFGNAESMHGGVLSELVDVLDAYRTRIPLVLVFETAVSVDLFQEKLTRRALRQLKAVTFATASASETVERIFESLLTDPVHSLVPGPNLATMLMDRQAEHMQSALAFSREIKYMYMVHFHRSPFSVILDGNQDDIQASAELVEAARGTKSFKNYVDDLKSDKDFKKANELLKKDASVKALLAEEVPAARKEIRNLLEAARTVRLIYDHVSTKGTLTWSKLYIQTMTDQLSQATLEHVRMSLLATPSDRMRQLLGELALDDNQFLPFQDELESLIEKHEAYEEPLRTENDPGREQTRTKVVAKRVTLSKQKTMLSEKDEEYTAFVAKLEEQMFEYLSERLVNPKEVLFNEVYVFDLRVPNREGFAPRPRFNLENALTVPGAYLACECCDPESRGLTSGQPATAILYQLYLESGAIINIADLWSAFEAVIQVDEGENASGSDKSSELKLALFYRALAELKYLGMIKASRKRADHLVKVKFIGL